MHFRWKTPRKHQHQCHHVIHSHSRISDMDFLWCYGILQHTGISESTLNKHWQNMIFVTVLERELSGYMF